MQIIYIHGFRSDANALKGQLLQDWCARHRPEVKVLRPDLNMPPIEVMALLSNLIVQDVQSAVIGSSLGGFFATACVAKFTVRGVLINPSVVPFESMKKYFAHGETEYVTEGGWHATAAQMDDFFGLYNPVPIHPENLLVLLKEGDAVLDYRIAAKHYSKAGAQSPMIIEPDGDHLMMDVVDKFPMIVDFLFPT